MFSTRYFFKYRIYLFGGSTIYCSEVPDKYTIASFLQKKINQYAKNLYRVENFGISSVNNSQLYERLLHTNIQKDDIIIFYGGVNDALLLTLGNINKNLTDDSKINYLRLNLLQRFNILIYENLKPYSRLVEIFMCPIKFKPPDYLIDSVRLNELSEQLFEKYVDIITRVDSVCNLKKCKFINIIQPHLFTRNHHSDYEKKIIQNKFITPPAWKISLEKGYVQILKAQEIFKNKNISSFDFTHLFNKYNQDFYLDICHVNEKANQIIAENIFLSLKPFMKTE